MWSTSLIGGVAMQVGIIKYWNANNSYGFICPKDGGEDVFFHLSAWLAQEPPRKGLQVYYRYQADKKGRPATAAVNTSPDLPELEKTSAFSQNENKKLTPLGKLFNSALLFILLIIACVFGFDFFTLKTHETPSVSNQGNFAYIQDVELKRTLALIEQGGPFPYPERDGSVFQNRERILPPKPHGYYREYTVPTPHERDRGARRVVTGGNPPEVYYYTEDHYRSFRQLEKSL